MTMIREEQPKPGSFDYLLKDIDETIWRDAGLGDPPRHTEKQPPLNVRLPYAKLMRIAKGAATPKTPPPTPPERTGGNGTRVHVEIVLPDPNRKPRRSVLSTAGGRWLARAILIWLGILALMAIAHAETWTSYQDSWIRRYHSDEGSSALSYKQGFTTIFQMTDKHGHTTECRSYKQGWQTITECD